LYSGSVKHTRKQKEQATHNKQKQIKIERRKKEMLRTNSKKAAENIRKYIMEDLEYLQERAEYRGMELDENNVDQVLALAWSIFKEEKSGEINRYRFINEYQVFKDWASGLALGNLFCYYYNRSAVEDLGNILEESAAEKAKYKEEDAEELLTRLIYREMTRAYNKTAF
jgi:hypothetical protein